MWNRLLKEFDCDMEHRIQAIFSSIFIMQNRMQTAGEKIQTQISMKQWLLLAMAGSCPEPRTLTNLGTLMGCSRQNVKKLALALEKRGENLRHALVLVFGRAGFDSDFFRL